MFVVANIGLDGLLGTEALQSCLPHQLDLRTGQLWAAGRPFDTTVRSTETDSEDGWIFDNFGSTADNEIVAPFYVSGVLAELLCFGGAFYDLDG